MRGCCGVARRTGRCGREAAAWRAGRGGGEDYAVDRADRDSGEDRDGGHDAEGRLVRRRGGRGRRGGDGEVGRWKLRSSGGRGRRRHHDGGKGGGGGVLDGWSLCEEEKHREAVFFFLIDRPPPRIEPRRVRAFREAEGELGEAACVEVRGGRGGEKPG